MIHAFVIGLSRDSRAFAHAGTTLLLPLVAAVVAGALGG